MFADTEHGVHGDRDAAPRPIVTTTEPRIFATAVDDAGPVLANVADRRRRDANVRALSTIVAGTGQADG